MFMMLKSEPRLIDTQPVFVVTVLSHVDGSHGIGLSPAFVCLSLFIHTISQELLQLGSPNLTAKCSQHESWRPIYFGIKSSKFNLKN